MVSGVPYLSLIIILIILLGVALFSLFVVGSILLITYLTKKR